MTSSFSIWQCGLKSPCLGEAVTRLFPLIFNTTVFLKSDVGSRHIVSTNACETLAGKASYWQKDEKLVLWISFNVIMSDE